MTDASQDLFLRDLEEQFGDAGYAFWFKTLELLGSQGKDGVMEISETVWRQVIDSRRTDHLRRIYESVTKKEKIQVEQLGEGVVRVTCPKFKEFSDTYTSRVRTLFEHSSKNVSARSRSRSRRRLEEEKDKIREGSKETFFKNGEKPEGKKIPPTILVTQEYFKSREWPDAQALKFWNYYDSNGWKVGKNPMRNWHSAAANWMGNVTDRKAPDWRQRFLDGETANG